MFRDALAEIDRYLNENKRCRTKILDWVSNKEKRKGIEQRLTSLEKLVEKSDNVLGVIKKTVHGAMTVIPAATISILLIQSFIYLLNVVFLKKFYWDILSDWPLIIPKTIDTITLLFCVAYLAVIITTRHWKNKPKELYKEVLKHDALLKIVDTDKIPKQDQDSENKCLSCVAQRIEHLSSLQIDQVDCKSCWAALPKGLDPVPAAASN